MAISRLTLTQIRNEILRIAGYDSSGLAPWSDDATLLRQVNSYASRLTARCAQVLRESGMPISTGTVHFDMWRYTGTLDATSGSQTVTFPVDYDRWISFYDSTNKRRLEVVTEVDRWHVRKLRDKPAGPPEAIELMGFGTAVSGLPSTGGEGVRVGKLYPATVTGTTPSISLHYWRLPTAMPGNNFDLEYPDCDPKFQMLWVYGPALEFLRPSDPGFARYQGLERELLIDLAYGAKAA